MLRTSLFLTRCFIFSAAKALSFHLAIMLVVNLATINHGWAQSADIQNRMEALKKLKKAEYVNEGIALGLELAKEGYYDLSLTYFNKASTRAFWLNNRQAITKVAKNRAEAVIQYFPNDHNGVKEAAKGLKRAEKKVGSSSELRELNVLSERLLAKTPELTTVKIDTAIKPNKQIGFFTTTAGNTSTSMANKLDSLKEVHEDLNAHLQAKNSELNEMTREMLEQTAIIEYNKRIIDSIKFKTEMDSFVLAIKESQIGEQKAELELKNSQRNLFLASGAIALLLSIGLLLMYLSSNRFNRKLKQKNEIIATEKEASEQLLLNILPKQIANELKEKGRVRAKRFAQVTVMFADFVGFSNIAKELTPSEIVNTLHHLFSKFDEITKHHKVEKIKTIGDAYMCVCGVPEAVESHAQKTVKAAIEMQGYMYKWNAERERNNLPKFLMRIGINTGSLTAGVVGSHKFVYDVWGDSVNIAARIESAGEPGKINVSEHTAALLNESVELKPRGFIEVKNMDDLSMFFVEEGQVL